MAKYEKGDDGAREIRELARKSGDLERLIIQALQRPDTRAEVLTDLADPAVFGASGWLLFALSRFKSTVSTP